MGSYKVRIEKTLVQEVEGSGDTAAEAIASVKAAYEAGNYAKGFSCVKFTIDEPSDDEAGICPLCGTLIDHGERESMDEGGVYYWTCPRCGATGCEGYNETFDGHHYNVRDKDGKPVPGRDD